MTQLSHYLNQIASYTFQIIKNNIAYILCCSINFNNIQYRLGGTYINNTIMYKGYIGSVEFSEEDYIFFGKVLGIRSLISYEGENAKELLDDFHGAVDDYLDVCTADETLNNSPAAKINI